MISFPKGSGTVLYEDDINMLSSANQVVISGNNQLAYSPTVPKSGLFSASYFSADRFYFKSIGSGIDSAYAVTGSVAVTNGTNKNYTVLNNGSMLGLEGGATSYVRVFSAIDSDTVTGSFTTFVQSRYICTNFANGSTFLVLGSSTVQSGLIFHHSGLSNVYLGSILLGTSLAAPANYSSQSIASLSNGNILLGMKNNGAYSGCVWLISGPSNSTVLGSSVTFVGQANDFNLCGNANKTFLAQNGSLIFLLSGVSVLGSSFFYTPLATSLTNHFAGQVSPINGSVVSHATNSKIYLEGTTDTSIFPGSVYALPGGNRKFSIFVSNGSLFVNGIFRWL